MNTGDLPALIDFLHQELLNGDLVQEHHLLRASEHLEIFSLCSDDPTLGLFQKHFLLMHALYVLRQDLYEAELSILHIDGTRIQLLPWPESVADSHELASFQHSEKLEAYYLDFSNVIRETESSVASMLGQFWRRYSEHALVNESEIIAAAEYMGLSWPCTELQLKKRYRERARRSHPDMGGSSDDFIALRRSYETLKMALQQQASSNG